MPITADDLRAAHARTAPYVRRTPLLAADPGSFGDADVSFKLELLQHAGSFKARGAFNNLVSRAIPAAGVTAASGGNHGVAVALAARRLGHAATIFVPEISSPVKVAAIRAQGAEVVIGGARYADAQAACDRHARESGALLVHPFDAEATIAGAGSLAIEWEEDRARFGLAPLDTVLIAVGGGGLIAGVAAWWRGRVKIVGVEPEGSRCLHAALEAGHPVDVTVESVAADSLGARRVGELAFGIAREAVERVVLVDDDAIRAAQGALWTGYRIAAEPGGATALAALAAGAYQPTKGERVGVLVCGGNVELGSLAEITARQAARTCCERSSDPCERSPSRVGSESFDARASASSRPSSQAPAHS
jgi:threonine dehydratase